MALTGCAPPLLWIIRGAETSFTQLTTQRRNAVCLLGVLQLPESRTKAPESPTKATKGELFRSPESPTKGELRSLSIRCRHPGDTPRITQLTTQRRDAVWWLELGAPPCLESVTFTDSHGILNSLFQ